MGIYIISLSRHRYDVIFLPFKSLIYFFFATREHGTSQPDPFKYSSFLPSLNRLVETRNWKKKKEEKQKKRDIRLVLGSIFLSSRYIFYHFDRVISSLVIQSHSLEIRYFFRENGIILPRAFDCRANQSIYFARTYWTLPMTCRTSAFRPILLPCH